MKKPSKTSSHASVIKSVGSEPTNVELSPVACLAKIPTEPTPTELALIAAALSRESARREQTDLAHDALSLWECCAALIRRRRQPGRHRLVELCSSIPQPKQFPVSVDIFLKLMMERKSRTDRWPVYRRFKMDWQELLKLAIAAQHLKPDELPKAGELSDADELDSRAYNHRAFCFTEWYRADFPAIKSRASYTRKNIAKNNAEEAKRGETPQKQALLAAMKRWDAAAQADLRTMGLF